VIIILILLPIILLAAPKVCIILPETGPHAEIALLARSALELAFENTHRKGQPLLELIFVDNYNNPDSARVAAERLAGMPDVIALAGGYPSACCAEIIQVAERRNIPYLIISASADTLTRASNPNVFRLAPPTSGYNDGLISWVITTIGSHSSVAVLYDDRPQWAEAVKDFTRDFDGRWSWRIDYIAFSAGERDFQGRINDISHIKPAVVWLIGGTGDIARFLRQCREAEFAPAAFVIGTVKQVNQKLISASEGAADYSFGPAIWWHTHPYPGEKAFVELFQKHTGVTPDYHSAEAFAAGQVMLRAMDRAEMNTREALRNSLSLIDMVTVLGEVKFEAYRGFTNQNRVRTSTLQLHGDRWVTVWSPQLATENYIYPIPEWRDRGLKTKMNTKPTVILLLMVALIWILLTAGSRKRKEIQKQMDR